MNALSDDSTADRRQRLRQRLQRALLLSPCESDASESALSGDTTIDDPSFQGEDDELEPSFAANEGEQSPGDEHPAPNKETAPAFYVPQKSERIETPDSKIAFQCLADLDNRMNALEDVLHEQKVWNQSTIHILEDVSNRLAAAEATIEAMTDAGKKTTGRRRRSARQSAHPPQ